MGLHWSDRVVMVLAFNDDKSRIQVEGGNCDSSFGRNKKGQSKSKMDIYFDIFAYIRDFS